MSAISSRLQSASGHREGGRVVGGGGEKELPENGQAVGERRRGRSEPGAPGLSLSPQERPFPLRGHVQDGGRGHGLEGPVCSVGVCWGRIMRKTNEDHNPQKSVTPRQRCFLLSSNSTQSARDPDGCVLPTVHALHWLGLTSPMHQHLPSLFTQEAPAARINRRLPSQTPPALSASRRPLDLVHAGLRPRPTNYSASYSSLQS
jgi:hypothetical protein